MMIRLKVFAAAKDVAKEIVKDGHVELELPDEARISDLKVALVKRVPDLETLVTRSAFAIDQKYVSDDNVILESYEIAMIPPVSGG